MPWSIPTSIPLPPDFKGFDPQHTIGLIDFRRYERHLPHWRLPGACYFTTFRLNDSIPTEIAQQFRQEKLHWEQRLALAASHHKGELPDHERSAYDAYQRTHLAKLEALVDGGHGECLLREASVRFFVDEALRYFEGTRCEMFAFVIMPNHVHAVCRPLAGHDIEKLAGSWKRHTADRIHRQLGRSGGLWQQESFGRIIRDADHFARVVRYIANNPVQAKLNEHEATVWFCDAIRVANGWPLVE
jgi:putative transposase